MAKSYAKKRLGQNFLQSQELIKKIISAVSPKTNDTIVEIGPGKGALTLPLTESGAAILAVEFDLHLCRYLEKALAGKKNVSIIQKDFLQFIPAEYGLT
ncbi:MAG TPA: rRNA adenine N-6-methyltransferase family protein, partial [candidate division Zixibacteria bacterium]|nr:rRNA adenine N-6-methyltransferase family protein [candidate division Zixibacteria bacterium]